MLGPQVPGQLVGFFGKLGLAFGDLLHIAFAGRFALQLLLLLDQLVDTLDVLLDSLLFRLQAFRAVFAQQQLQQFGQILLDRGLILDRRCQPLLPQQFDQLGQLGFDALLLALSHGLAQQGRSVGIGAGRQLGHPQQLFLQLAVALQNLLLLGGQRRCLGGRCGFGRRILGRGILSRSILCPGQAPLRECPGEADCQ